MPDHPVQPEVWSPPAPLPAPLKTERLLIRRWEPTDATGLFEAVDSSRDTLLPWLDWAATDHRSVEQTRTSLERSIGHAHDPERESFSHGIFDRKNARVLGSVGMHRFVRTQRTVEIGYWLRTDARGKGFVTEAVRHTLSSAFTPQAQGGWGLHRIVILSSGPNTASQRVPETLGLRKELFARAGRYIDPLGWCDTHGWGVICEEWDIERHCLRA